MCNILRGNINMVWDVYRNPSSYNARLRLQAYAYILSGQFSDPKLKPDQNDVRLRVNTMMELEREKNPRDEELYSQLLDIIIEYLPTYIFPEGETYRNDRHQTDRHQNVRHLNDKQKKNIYADKENVHNSTLNSTVKEIAKQLIANYPTEILLHKIQKYLTQTYPDKRAVIDIFMNRIDIDTFFYDHLFDLRMVFRSVWVYIQNHPYRMDLEIRLLEEMEEAKGKCSTGHLSRMINSIQGFCDEAYCLRISDSDQANAVAQTYANKRLQEADELIQEGMVDKTPEYVTFINDIMKEKEEEWLNDYGSETTEAIMERIKTLYL